MPSLFERQKLIIERLYAKIDYHKAARIRIPTYVAIANFGLLALSIRAKPDPNTVYIFVIGFLVIGTVGGCSLELIRRAFKGNVEQLDYLYDQLDVKNIKFRKDSSVELAERASILWLLLFVLTFLATALPCILVLVGDFSPPQSKLRQVLSIFY